MKTIEEMIAVMEAAKEGKTIQFKNKYLDDWIDHPAPNWDWYYNDYRVKPEPKLRPYANAKEFLDAMKEHGPFISMDCEIYLMPLRVYNDEIEYGDDEDTCVPYVNLTDWYKWQDGTPCGIEEGGEE